MVSHATPKTFSAVSRLLGEHIGDAQARCSAFEHQCHAPEFLASMKGEDRVAAAQWWWREYTSLKDAIKSLIDGKIRHEYDRTKAVRTPNHEGIDWQKASLRTGESLDNLRRLLKHTKSKHEGEFDALNLEIEDLQESIKRIRESLVQAVRAARVNKFGEETQELRLKPRGGGGEELRLLPPCGNGIEGCVCGASSPPPRPVHDGSLKEAIEAAVAAAPAAAAAAAERGAKRRRVLSGPGSTGSGGDQERAGPGPEPRGRRRARQQAPPPESASDVPLDEIKRQMGKNPLQLERSKEALEEEETRGASGGRASGDRGGGGIVTGKAKPAAKEGRDRGQELDGRGGGGGTDDGGLAAGSEDEAQQPAGEGGGEDEEDWRDNLIGMQPHERAGTYEDRGMFREALKWHREDLVAARARALDGDDEDEREPSLDLARALRNTGRCLGRLGNSGFAESKNYLTEACELVGPDGPSPSPADEQDVVLELGNLWYNRYLLCDEQGVRFLADEALDAALRYYRESRELCVDLVADGDEGAAARGLKSAPTEAAAAAAAAARGGLLRAEYNVGMTLFERDERADAAGHLSAAVSIFRGIFAGGATGPENTPRQARGPGGDGGEEEAAAGEGGGGSAAEREIRAEAVEASTLAAWKSAGLEQAELAGLGGVYASSLLLLGECLASPSPSPPSSRGPSPPYSACALPPGKEGLPLPPPRAAAAAAEALEASAAAFLGVEDPARALEPLLKLVETLQQSDDDNGGGRRSLPRAEALCDRAASALLLLRRRRRRRRRLAAEDAPGADDSLEDESLELEQVREGIAALRARWRAGDSSSGGGSHDRQGASSPSGQQKRGPVGAEDANANTPPSRPINHAISLKRVGPLPTSGFAERRRRLRAAAASTTGGGGGARNASSRKNNRAPGSRNTTATEGLPAAARPVTYGDGGVGARREEWLARERVGSFAGLRASVAAGDGAAAWANARGTEGGAAGENGAGREEGASFISYREKCHDLQEEPNPLVLARLAQADGEQHAAPSAAGKDGGRGCWAASLPSEPRRRSLDLGACRLTDRELRVLLHVLSEERIGDKVAVAGAASAGEATTSGQATGTAGGARFSTLLLDGNPGIGAGALGALWGGSGGGGGGSGNDSQSSLFSLLVRLDLSKCGLTAADLVSFSSTGGDVSASGRVSAAAVCLQTLVLRDNPLTRVKRGVGRGAGAGQAAQHWIESARRGAAALRDLIARAPALEILDVSGCSQIPGGPAGRLYSPEVSDHLASALSSGLEARVAGKASAGTGHSGSGNGNGNVGGGGESDGRAQVSTLRVGNNRFFRSSWRRVLEHLASYPPRELDLSFGSVLPRCSAAAVAPDAAESRTAGGRGAPSSATAAAAAAIVADSDVAPPAGLPEDPAPEQSLGELLAAAVLPADASGVEVLDLTGSTDLLLPPPPHQEAGGGRADGGALPPCPSTAAFLVLLRDALVSPLCSTTHLLLSGVRGSSPSPLPSETAADENASSSSCCPSSRGQAPPRAFDPRVAGSLCEAASTCASLRCLDLAGSDLSGPAGASAAAAAVSCLLARDDDDGYGAPVARGLDRLSLRACGLGASGLSAVMRALVALPGVGGPGGRRDGPLPRFPRLLDLSDNRPLVACAGAGAGASVDGARRGRDGGGAQAGQPAGLEEVDAAALSELAASARALQRGGSASVIVSFDPRRPPVRLRTSTSHEPALIDLSGNRLDFVVGST